MLDREEAEDVALGPLGGDTAGVWLDRYDGPKFGACMDPKPGGTGGLGLSGAALGAAKGMLGGRDPHALEPYPGICAGHAQQSKKRQKALHEHGHAKVRCDADHADALGSSANVIEKDQNYPL